MRRLSAVVCSTARTSCSRSRTRSRSPTSWRQRAAPSMARTTSRWSRARSRPSTTPSGSSRSASVSKALVTIGACATAGGIQALRNFGDVAEFARLVYASPEYISTLATSTPISAHVPVDFELHGCPINKRQLLEVITRVPARSAARHPLDERLHGVQAARDRLRHGRARDAVPRPGHARGLRRPLPVLQPRLLRLLRPEGDAEHRLADAAAAACSAWTSADSMRVFHTFNTERAAFREAARAVTERRTIKTDYLARVEGEGAMSVRLQRRRGRGRRAADLRAAALLRGAAPRPLVHWRRRTSPPGSAASAPSPTR